MEPKLGTIPYSLTFLVSQENGQMLVNTYLCSVYFCWVPIDIGSKVQFSACNNKMGKRERHTKAYKKTENRRMHDNTTLFDSLGL